MLAGRFLRNRPLPHRRLRKMKKSPLTITSYESSCGGLLVCYPFVSSLTLATRFSAVAPGDRVDSPVENQTHGNSPLDSVVNINARKNEESPAEIVPNTNLAPISKAISSRNKRIVPMGPTGELGQNPSIPTGIREQPPPSEGGRKQKRQGSSSSHFRDRDANAGAARGERGPSHP